MTTPYEGDPSTYHDEVAIPDDGELSNATLLGAALEELADNAAANRSRGLSGTALEMQAHSGSVGDEWMLIDDTIPPGGGAIKHPAKYVLLHPGAMSATWYMVPATAMGSGWYWYRCHYPSERSVIETGELYSSACDLDNANASTSYVSLLTSGTIEIDGLAVGDEIEFTIGPFEVYTEGTFGEFQLEVVDDATGGTCLATSHAKVASPALLTFGYRYVKAGVTTDTIQLDPQIAGDGDPFHAVAAMGAKRFLGTYRVVRP